ncbi:MAG: hypothetical protein GY749_42305 [Desulfobacteraceae bacterium]|nr:hypothetical protein [Desulfobacteraceae bacterium]
MYKDEYHPRVKKDLKKLDARLREEIKIIHIPAVLSNPDSGESARNRVFLKNPVSHALFVTFLGIKGAF